MPLISVVIPVGPRHAPHLPTARASVAWQTLPAAWIETIVVNDTGAPLAGATTAVASGGRAGLTRNAGLAAATAPLITFLDADDYLPPTALEALLRGYAHGDDGYTYGDWWADRGDGPPAYVTARHSEQRLQLRGAGVHVITALMATADARRVGGFCDWLGWEDWEFWSKCAVNGLCGRRVAHPIVVYRLTHGDRREKSPTRRDELRAAHQALYGRYLTGEEPLMACCGGDTTTKAQARRAVAHLGPVAQEVTLAGEKVRMEFVGAARGPVTWRSPMTRQSYRGANNAVDRFIDALPEDVAWLESLMVWRRVPRMPRVAPPAPPVAADTAAESYAPGVVSAEVGSAAEPIPGPHTVEQADAPAQPPAPRRRQRGRKADA
jgi:Glycosyl transferase family 2